MRGVIKKIVSDRGFSFVKPTTGADVFLHHSGMAEGFNFDDLKEGDTVEFDTTTGEKGPRASAVRPVKV